MEMFHNLEQALLDRAEAMGKRAEMQAAIAKIKREVQQDNAGWPAYERALVTTYADGILYENWPWVKI